MKTFEGRSDAIVGYLRANVTANVGRRDDIITVAVKSPHKEDAAYIANAIVGAYKTDLESQKKSSIRDIIKFYEKESATSRGSWKRRRPDAQLQRKYPDLALGSRAFQSCTRSGRAVLVRTH